MAVPIQHTVKKITASVSGAIIDTALGSELFPAVNGVYPESIAISITNTDATDAMYVQLTDGAASTLSTTVFTEKIPATESRQFQIERPHPIEAQETIRIFILGAASPGTTYTATCFI
jgi:hypothetical protein